MPFLVGALSLPGCSIQSVSTGTSHTLAVYQQSQTLRTWKQQQQQSERGRGRDCCHDIEPRKCVAFGRGIDGDAVTAMVHGGSGDMEMHQSPIRHRTEHAGRRSSRPFRSLTPSSTSPSSSPLSPEAWGTGGSVDCSQTYGTLPQFLYCSPAFALLLHLLYVLLMA